MLLVAAAISLTAVACSSDSKSASSSSPAAVPEEQRASAAEVATGLAALKTITGSIASSAGTDKAAAQAAVDQIEPAWSKIEGTVKANNPDAYISFEDSFALLETAVKDGDAAKAQQGAGDVAKAADSYVAKYPG